MSRREGRCGRWTGALLCVVAGLAGCQGEDGFSLTPPGLDLSKPGRAEPKLLDPCTDLPLEQDVVRELLAALNAERAKHSLRPVRLNPTLTRVAEFWACRMIEDGFFGHEDPFDGSTVDSRAVNFGYAFRKLGENLAAGHVSVKEVLAHWMRSPGHRTNLLDPAYVDVGIAVKRGGEYGIYWVQEFGRPISASSDTVAGGPTDGREMGSAIHEPSTQPAPAGPAIAPPSRRHSASDPRRDRIPERGRRSHREAEDVLARRPARHRVDGF